MDLINGECHEINTEIVFSALLQPLLVSFCSHFAGRLNILDILKISQFVIIFQKDLKFKGESRFGKTA